MALEGPQALMRLPSLMDEVMENWKKASTAPYFKAEYTVHHNGVASLREAARATSARLKLGPAAGERTMAEYVGYTRELSGPGVKPVADLVKLGAGLHGYATAEAQLPMGVLPAVAQMWDDAIKAGHFKPERSPGSRVRP